MTRSAFFALAVFAGSTALLAQDRPAPTYASEVKQNYARAKANIMKAAEKMPEENYSFKPTPEIRSFAQLFTHIAGAQQGICGGVLGAPGKADESKTSKADVLAELKKSFDVCDKAFESINDANAGTVAGQGFMGGTLVGRLYGNVIHDNEMYGTIAVYLRLKGVVPPSSEPRAMGGR